jgi:hypothetical protein
MKILDVNGRVAEVHMVRRTRLANGMVEVWIDGKKVGTYSDDEAAKKSVPDWLKRAIQQETPQDTGDPYDLWLPNG